MSAGLGQDVRPAEVPSDAIAIMMTGRPAAATTSASPLSNNRSHRSPTACTTSATAARATPQRECPAKEVARRLAHSVKVLWKAYAGCLDSDEEGINRMVEGARRVRRTTVTGFQFIPGSFAFCRLTWANVSALIPRISRDQRPRPAFGGIRLHTTKPRRPASCLVNQGFCW